MDKLLIIADDITGGLDASVAFAKAGIATCVGLGEYFIENTDVVNCSVQVSVLETRHLSKLEAYSTVFSLVKKAESSGFTHILKKIDSALRGNVGAELTAVLDASDDELIAFIPAYPQMNRITKDGIQYIDGSIPVAESVFGTDPFTPVRHSYIPDLLLETGIAPAYVVGDKEIEMKPGIAIYNAATDDEMFETAWYLIKEKRMRLFAGCAGLSCALTRILQFDRDAAAWEYPKGNLAVFCGSINPISLEQCKAATAEGAPYFRMIQNGIFADTDEMAGHIAKATEEYPITVFNTGDACVGAEGQEAVERGKKIAERISRLIRGAGNCGMRAVLLVIGGDTLIALIKDLGIGSLIPLAEVEPGVVLSKYLYHGEWRYLLSKSGGFGERDLFSHISKKLNGNVEGGYDRRMK